MARISLPNRCLCQRTGERITTCGSQSGTATGGALGRAEGEKPSSDIKGNCHLDRGHHLVCKALPFLLAHLTLIMNARHFIL